jgi:hypothetical protein
MSASDTGPGPVDTSKHDNVVYITDKTNTVTGITYVDNSLVISKGQPSTPPVNVTANGDGQYTLSLDAGRHGTAAVGGDYSKATDGTNHQFCTLTGTNSRVLNFYYAVKISFKSGAIVTVYLAQGHYSGHNPWFIGANCITDNYRDSSGTLNVPAANGQPAFGIRMTAQSILTHCYSFTFGG